jgi:hypothetical protein
MQASSPLLKVVLTSGYPTGMWSDSDTVLFRELRADTVRILPKPFMSSDVLSIVDALIGPSAMGSKWATVG